ncbi:hypothetical protein ACF3NV_01450 [Moraxella atlantae]
MPLCISIIGQLLYPSRLADRQTLPSSPDFARQVFGFLFAQT